MLTPYDFFFDPGSGGACTLQLKQFEHKATVVFWYPGTAEIVLRYSTGGWNSTADGLKVYTVEVLPRR